MLKAAETHDLIYKVLTHPRLGKILKIIGAIMVFATSYWYFKNFDKIMGTEEGKKQIQREWEEERDEKLRDLAGEGNWNMHEIPDLPPIAYDPGGSWKTVVTQKPPPPTSRGKLNSLPRVERGKSGGFVDGLLVLNNLRLEPGKDRPDSSIDTPLIYGLLSNNGSHYLDDARVDILFMDGKDNVLMRRSINPLVVSGGLFGDKIKPLYPGETREITIDASQTPTGWIDQLMVEVVYYQLVP